MICRSQCLWKNLNPSEIPKALTALRHYVISPLTETVLNCICYEWFVYILVKVTDALKKTYLKHSFRWLNSKPLNVFSWIFRKSFYSEWQCCSCRFWWSWDETASIVLLVSVSYSYISVPCVFCVSHHKMSQLCF